MLNHPPLFNNMRPRALDPNRRQNQTLLADDGPIEFCITKNI